MPRLFSLPTSTSLTLTATQLIQGADETLQLPLLAISLLRWRLDLWILRFNDLPLASREQSRPDYKRPPISASVRSNEGHADFVEGLWASVKHISVGSGGYDHR